MYGSTIAIYKLNEKESDIQSKLELLSNNLEFPPYKKAIFIKDKSKVLAPKEYGFDYHYWTFTKAKGSYLKVYKNINSKGSSYHKYNKNEWFLKLIIRDDFNLDEASILKEMEDYLKQVFPEIEKIKSKV